MAESFTRGSPSKGAAVVLFLGLLAICFGLGYPALTRYDPREKGKGTPDAGVYYQMVVGGEVGAPAAYRVLTPTLARGVLRVTSWMNLGSWDPVLLSLLVVNAAFSSLSALVVMRLAAGVTQDGAAALLAPFVYLSNFTVVNAHLAGLVDAAEGFFLAALLLALLRGRWLWAPLLLGVGALAKETVVPLGLCAMVVWWIALWWRGTRPAWVPALAVGLALLAGVAVLGVCRVLVPVPPYEAHAFSWSRLAGMLGALPAVLFSRPLVYAFAFLVPFGIVRLRSIPMPLLAASLSMAVLAVMFGAYAQIGENIYRPLFNTLGPVLVIACSVFLRDLVRRW